MEIQITIFGATGFVGKHLVEQALERGYSIKILAKSKEKLGTLNPRVQVIEGNYFNKTKISEAMEGSMAVLSTIGPPMDVKAKDVDEHSYHEALRHLISSMTSMRINKFINISGAAIPYPGEKLSFNRKMLRLMLKLMAKQMIKVKDGELAILFNSKVNFTNVRPPMIKELVGEYKTDENSFVGSKVGVKQICSFMLDNIESEEWNRKAPLIANN